MAQWYDSTGLTVGQAIDIPPVWLLGMMGVGWLQSVVLPGLTYEVLVAQLVGAGLAAVGVALMVWSVAAFRAHRTSVVPHQTPARIITTGPFRFTRNPIYLGDAAVLAGAVLWWGAWPSLLLIPLFVWIIGRRFIAPEEARLKESFAAEFADFAKKSPRWL